MTTQATREASTTSEGGGGVETTVVEDEGLGGEEVFVHHHYSDSFSLSTLISFVIMVITTLAIMKYDHRHPCFKHQEGSESSKAELKTLRSLFDQAKLDNRW